MNDFTPRSHLQPRFDAKDLLHALLRVWLLGSGTATATCLNARYGWVLAL